MFENVDRQFLIALKSRIDGCHLIHGGSDLPGSLPVVRGKGLSFSAQHLLDDILNTVPSFGPSNSRKTSINCSEFSRGPSR